MTAIVQAFSRVTGIEIEAESLGPILLFSASVSCFFARSDNLRLASERRIFLDNLSKRKPADAGGAGGQVL
jgi:hypothetical protein